MKEKKYTATLGVIIASLMVVLFFTGASQNQGMKQWSISSVSGEKHGLYIMDQSTGDIYFLDDDPRVTRSHAVIRKLGNISDAR